MGKKIKRENKNKKTEGEGGVGGEENLRVWSYSLLIHLRGYFFQNVLSKLSEVNFISHHFIQIQCQLLSGRFISSN